MVSYVSMGSKWAIEITDRRGGEGAAGGAEIDGILSTRDRSVEDMSSCPAVMVLQHAHVSSLSNSKLEDRWSAANT